MATQIASLTLAMTQAVPAHVASCWSEPYYLVKMSLAPTYMTGVPTSRGIPSAEMTTGRKVAVLEVDDANPSDAVVIAVWT